MAGSRVPWALLPGEDGVLRPSPHQDLHARIVQAIFRHRRGHAQPDAGRGQVESANPMPTRLKKRIASRNLRQARPHGLQVEVGRHGLFLLDLLRGFVTEARGKVVICHYVHHDVVGVRRLAFDVLDEVLEGPQVPPDLLAVLGHGETVEHERLDGAVAQASTCRENFQGVLHPSDGTARDVVDVETAVLHDKAVLVEELVAPHGLPGTVPAESVAVW
mmetsp:Transcript_89595/g.253940  ORF Transcript_89595/g.253940 Transcript_89595/m.253940 type:complete len:218 (+) Transcript_89595:143-796(+)